MKAKTEKIAPGTVCLCYGEDIARVQKLTQKLITDAVGENRDIALTELDPDKIDLTEFERLIQQPALFCPLHLIRIHDFNVEKLTEKNTQRFLDSLGKISELCAVLLDVTGFDLKKGKKTVAGKQKKLIQAVEQHGTVFEMVQPDHHTLAKQLMDRVAKEGKILPRESADVLVELCMGKTLVIEQEFVKVCCLVEKGETITPEMVRMCVTPQPESTAFKLSGAIASGQAKAAMQELDKLYAMRVDRTIIVGAIAGAFIDMYRAATARDSRHGIDEVAKDFGYRYDFMVKNAFGNVRRLQTTQLRKCILILENLQKDLNSKSGEERIRIEAAMIQMLRVMRR